MGSSRFLAGPRCSPKSTWVSWNNIASILRLLAPYRYTSFYAGAVHGGSWVRWLWLGCPITLTHNCHRWKPMVEDISCRMGHVLLAAWIAGEQNESRVYAAGLVFKSVERGYGTAYGDSTRAWEAFRAEVDCACTSPARVARAALRDFRFNGRDMCNQYLFILIQMVTQLCYSSISFTPGPSLDADLLIGSLAAGRTLFCLPHDDQHWPELLRTLEQQCCLIK